MISNREKPPDSSHRFSLRLIGSERGFSFSTQRNSMCHSLRVAEELRAELSCESLCRVGLSLFPEDCRNSNKTQVIVG